MQLKAAIDELKKAQESPAGRHDGGSDIDQIPTPDDEQEEEEKSLQTSYEAARNLASAFNKMTKALKLDDTCETLPAIGL